MDPLPTRIDVDFSTDAKSYDAQAAELLALANLHQNKLCTYWICRAAADRINIACWTFTSGQERTKPVWVINWTIGTELRHKETYHTFGEVLKELSKWMKDIDTHIKTYKD